jgi:ElaB/YqjD/DUF883 family membrane-anchored ribosome-binding protein
MFRNPHARATAIDVAEIGRRMQAIEKRLERMSNGRSVSRWSAGVSQATDRAGDVVATALSEIADRFRGGARSVSGEASRFGNEAARLGNDALRRVAEEVEHRPLMLLAVAAGLGFLVGAVARRS